MTSFNSICFVTQQKCHEITIFCFSLFSAFEDFEETNSENKGDEKIESKSASKKPNFRRPDGKCVFGALVERNGNWDPPIKMLTGNSGLQDKGRILEISGSSNFNVWNKNSFCDRVSGICISNNNIFVHSSKI